ncbi:uncharacterized protein [Miscanthus floridulus]|uniref:uncharacterized protein n=1 Tax=Miscanthus floridulus TaxID=154761 RepID=UPI00345AE657
MSYIDRDKLSLPEVVGHLRDHCNVKEGTILHWLFPGRDMSTGLRALVDDKVCQIMSDCIVEGDVADVYAENHEYDAAIEASVYEEEMEENSKDNEIEDEDLQPLTIWKGESKEIDKQVDLVSQFYCTPNNMPGDTNGDEMSNTDGEYMPGDSCSSGDDEEATQIHKKFKDFKKKIKKGEAASLDDVIYEGVDSRPQNEQEDEDDGNNTPYLDSSDAEYIDELGGTGQGSLYPRFNKKKPVVKFKLGMKFSSKKQFKKAALKHGLDERKVIRFIKNDPKRVRAICDWEGCPWVCLLSNTSRSDSWQISTFTNNHMCPPKRDNKLVTSAVIARKYEKFIFANPCWKIPHMQQTVQEEMFATVSKSKLKRAKSLVMQKALDATKKQYSRLYDYQMELLRSNPGSNVIVNKEDNVEPPIFRRMYICLHACKEGFKAGCRKVVGLDGCFFKGATNGELLCAIGRDANNQMYPIAWAVVDKENNDNWDWFCDMLFRDVGVQGGHGWVFISDQQKGILNAVSKWAPEAEHRNCARHIYTNWKKEFTKKDYQKKFWRCAKAPCLMLFNLARAKLAQHTRAGAQAIMNTHPQHWSRAWFRLGSNCDSVDNNICESFNKWIIEARFFPIITMLETIRRKVMVRIQEQRTKSQKWTMVICPNINKKFNVYISMSAHCHAICNGNDKFEVQHFDNRFTVDLVSKKCSCRYWQLSGLPCCHAISCILFKTNCLDEYVADCYFVHHFNQTYSHCLNPVEGMNSWPASDREPLRAPGYVKMPGRPKTERRREPTEVRKATKMSKTGTIIRCSKCRLPGHNKSTCTNISGAGPSHAGGSQRAGGSSQSIPVSQPTGYKSVPVSQPTGSQSAAGEHGKWYKKDCYI